MTKCRDIGVLATILVLAASTGASAQPSPQAYPGRIIRIVTTEAGGGSDFASRLIAHGITSSLSQQVIVENRGIQAAEVVSRAPADGYTLLLNGPTIWLLPFLRDKVAYDPVNDFAPITLVTKAPNVLVVHPSVPASSVRELISLARKRAGQLNFGTSGTGNSVHVAGELFRTMAHVEIVRVNYKGAAASLTALVSGEVQLIFANAAGGLPLAKSGKLRALAVTSAMPSPLAPGLPTVAASGLPGYEASALIGAFAPAGTPAAIVARLNQEILRVLASADAQERLLASGVEGAGTTPEAWGAIMKSEMTKWGKVIRDAGIRED